jgi:hypothetical protein
MKSKSTTYLYGTAIILAGLFLLVQTNNNFETIKLTLATILTVGAVFAFLSAYYRQKKQVQYAYHEIHALVMLAYGLSVFFFCHKLETLVNFTAFLFIFYTFSEIIISFQVFYLGKKVAYKVVLIRVFLGLLVGVGTAIILSSYYKNFMEILTAFGLLFIIIGTNVILYLPILKIKETKA